MKAYHSPSLFEYFSELDGPFSQSVSWPLTAVTVDSLVEGIHFPEHTPAQWIAHKALAVNLSDLAAMGATPLAYTVALVLPLWDESWLHDFRQGLVELHDQYRLNLLDCDVRCGPMSVTIQAYGGVDKQSALLRSAACVGDNIVVTGSLGDAACALPYYLNQKPLPEQFAGFLRQRFNCPYPRVEVGLALATIARAAIDISDGLSQDLAHILTASKVGAIVHVDQLPASAALTSLLDESERLRCQLGGGDDYELCFTLPKKNMALLDQHFSQLDVTYSVIGEIVNGSGITYKNNNHTINPEVHAYDHFANAT